MDNYKEKYEQALEKAKQLCAYPTTQPFVNDLQDIFPELAETEIEDERIRQEMIDFLQETIDNVGESPNIWTMANAKKWLAWLEKQSEQKPADKFDIPDNRIENDISVTSRMEHVSEALKPIAKFILGYSHWNLHKDEWNHPVPEVPLFRVLDALVQEGKPYQGCDSCIEQKPVEWSEEDERIYQSIMDDTVQENQLCDKQITWLKSLKDRCLPQSKQEWSEKEEEIRNKLIDVFEGIVTEGLTANLTFRQIQEFIGWLKSLKGKTLSQPKQEWSEEDEAMFRSILTDVKIAWKNTLNAFEDDIEQYQEQERCMNKVLSFLKSLRPQKQCSNDIPSKEYILNVWELGNYWKELTGGVCNTEHGTQLEYIQKHWKEGGYYDKIISCTQKQWKPSEEQMEALKEALDKDWDVDGNSPLYRLYEQLKEL